MDDKRVQLRQVQMSPTDFEVREEITGFLIPCLNL